MKYLSIAQTAERWGISPAVFRFYAARGVSPVLSALAQSGDPRGRRKASGREHQERQVYQEARRKRKMSRIISATLTRNNGVYSTSRVRMGALPPCHEST